MCLYACVTDSFTRLFADDTGLHTYHKDLDSLIEISRNDIKRLFQWCIHNKLSINYDKTCFVLFHSKNRKIPLNFDSIDVDGFVIKRVSSTKYLGFILDEKLTWHDHISFLCNSLIFEVPFIKSSNNSE